MYVYLILSNIGNKPLFQWRQYASKLLKACCASYAKGLRSLQRSTGPFAYRSLCLLCATLAVSVFRKPLSPNPLEVGWWAKIPTSLTLYSWLPTHYKLQQLQSEEQKVRIDDQTETSATKRLENRGRFWGKTRWIYNEKSLPENLKGFGGSRGSRTPDPLLVRQML